MPKQHNIKVIPVPRKEPDLHKLARALLVLVGELPATEERPPKKGAE